MQKGTIEWGKYDCVFEIGVLVYVLFVIRVVLLAMVKNR